MGRGALAGILVALAWVWAGVGVLAGPARSVPVRVALNWTPLADHAPYFVALDKGWYTAGGLDVELQFAKGSADAARRTDVGQTQFGITDAGTVVTAVGRGAGLTIVGMLFDHSPFAIWTRRETGIRTPRDLQGKKVGTPPGDAQRVMFPALAAANGIGPASVTFVNIEPAAKYAALAGRQVDAIFDFLTGQPFVYHAVGQENAVRILWSDYGVDLYGNAIVVNSGFLRERPEAVRALLDATYRGWQYAMEHPDEAITILKKHVPQIDTAQYRQNLDLVFQLFRSERYAANGIGWIAEDFMCHTVELVTRYIEVPGSVDCRTIYTNAYLTRYELPSSLRP